MIYINLEKCELNDIKILFQKLLSNDLESIEAAKEEMIDFICWKLEAMDKQIQDNGEIKLVYLEFEQLKEIIGLLSLKVENNKIVDIAKVSKYVLNQF